MAQGYSPAGGAFDAIKDALATWMALRADKRDRQDRLTRESADRDFRRDQLMQDDRQHQASIGIQRDTLDAQRQAREAQLARERKADFLDEFRMSDASRSGTFDPGWVQRAQNVGVKLDSSLQSQQGEGQSGQIPMGSAQPFLAPRLTAQERMAEGQQNRLLEQGHLDERYRRDQMAQSAEQHRAQMGSAAEQRALLKSQIDAQNANLSADNQRQAMQLTLRDMLAMEKADRSREGLQRSQQIAGAPATLGNLLGGGGATSIAPESAQQAMMRDASRLSRFHELGRRYGLSDAQLQMNPTTLAALVKGYLEEQEQTEAIRRALGTTSPGVVGTPTISAPRSLSR
jgi:hypothetical protein